MKIEGEIEKVAKTISGRNEVGDIGLEEFKDDDRSNRLNECVST